MDRRRDTPGNRGSFLQQVPAAQVVLEALAEERGAPVGLGAQDVRARRRHVDGRGAVVREAGQRPTARERRDADQVVAGQRAGRARVHVVVVALVARRGDDDGVEVPRDGERVLQVQVPGAARAAEAQVDHVRALLRGVDDPAADVGARPAAVPVEHADGHQRRLGRDARHARPVVRRRGSRARHVGAVELEVVGVAVVLHEVVTVHVVDPAVGVAVAAARRLARVLPQAATQVGVREIDAGVDDRDQLAGAARAVPGGERADAGVGREAPERSEEAVVGRRRERLVAVVRLRIRDVGAPLQAGERRPCRSVERDDLRLWEAQHLLQLDPSGVARRGALGRNGARLEADDRLAGHGAAALPRAAAPRRRPMPARVPRAAQAGSGVRAKASSTPIGDPESCL